MATGDITSITVRSDGFSADLVIEGFTTGATYDFGTPGSTSTSKMYLTVTSEGYDAAGVLGTISRTVYITKAMRKAYPNHASLDETGGGNLTVRVSLSDHVYDDDLIAGLTATAGAVTNTGGGAQQSAAHSGSGGTSNSSTLDYPVAFGQHDHIAGTITKSRVKASFPVAFNAFHGFGIACVKFTATGGTSSHSETATVTSQTSTQGPVTGLCFDAYRTTIPLSGFTQGETITLRVQVYPNVGDANSVMDTNGRTTTANECLGWNDATYICDKNNSLDVIRYVSSTGNDSTGDGSSGNPWLTIAKAYLTATVNIVRLMGTGTTYTMGTSGTRRTTNEWIVVEADSGATPTIQLTSTRTFRCERLKFVGLPITVAGTTSYLDGEDLDNFLCFQGCTFSNGSGALTTGPGYRSDCTYYLSCDGDLGETLWSINSFSSARVAQRFDDCAFGSASYGSPIDAWYRVVRCTSTYDVFGQKSAANVAPAQNGLVYGNNEILNTPAAISANCLELGKVEALSNVAVVGSPIEKLTGGSPAAIHLFADSAAFGCNHLIFSHNTAPGERVNFCYNDTGTSAVTYTNVFVLATNCNLFNIKTDTFGTPNGNRIGNHAQVYGVGFKYCNFDADSGSGSFLQEYPGLYATTATPSFEDAASDDYTPAEADTVLRSKVSLTGFPPVVAHDLYGTLRPSTYHIGAVQRKGAPGAWAFTTPANNATGQSITPLLGWSASDGANSYNIALVREQTKGSGQVGDGSLVIAWAGVVGLTLQLPDVPTTDPGTTGGTLTIDGWRYFMYGSAVRGSDGTDNTHPGTDDWDYDSFTTEAGASVLGGFRSRGRDRSR